MRRVVLRAEDRFEYRVGAYAGGGPCYVCIRSRIYELIIGEDYSLVGMCKGADRFVDMYSRYEMAL